MSRYEYVEPSEMPDWSRIEELKELKREIEKALEKAEGLGDLARDATQTQLHMKMEECNLEIVNLADEIDHNKLAPLMEKLADEHNDLAEGRELAPDADFSTVENKIGALEEAIAENRRALQELRSI